MTRLSASAALLLSATLASTLSACVHTQDQAKFDAQPAAEAITPAAPDEAALAVAALPPAPKVAPVMKPAWVKRVETQGVTDQDGKISMSAASVQPLYQDAKKQDTIFTQVNVQSSAQTDTPTGTSNVGLGYRRLIQRDLLVGVNGFYDRDWAQTLERTGADAELRWRTFNMAVNYYAGSDDGTKRALDGYDIQLGSQVPYLPWAQTTFARSDFFGAENTATETYTAGMKFDLLKYVQLDMAARGDGSGAEAGVVKLNFNLLPSQWGPQRRTAFGSSQPISSTPLETRDLRATTLEKVRRVNYIQSE